MTFKLNPQTINASTGAARFEEARINDPASHVKGMPIPSIDLSRSAVLLHRL
jgi:hypothetical protein